MNKKSSAAQNLVLPSLQDPSYWGITIVQNLLSIIGALFALLSIVIFTATSLTQVDITIKVNANPIEKCQKNPSNYCVSLQATEEQAQQIELNNLARIEVIAEGSYRRKTLEAKVFSIEKNIGDNEKESAHTIIVELASDSVTLPHPSPTFGLIIIGSQSGWHLLKSAIYRIF